MIRSFRCQETERLFRRVTSRRFPMEIQRVALRKLDYLHGTKHPDDLRRPPGNCLEALKGRRKGQWSTRINDQWRICFRWAEGAAHDVAIVDCHGGGGT